MGWVAAITFSQACRIVFVRCIPQGSGSGGRPFGKAFFCNVKRGILLKIPTYLLTYLGCRVGGCPHTCIVHVLFTML